MALIMTYDCGEESFVNTVTRVPLMAAPVDANIISSDLLYNVIGEDCDRLNMKACIAPHGNKDSARLDLRRVCSMYAPHSIHMLISLATIKKCNITKLDVNSASLQKGAASRNMYFVPLRESGDYGKCIWLVSTTAYNLLKENANSEIQSDESLLNIG